MLEIEDLHAWYGESHVLQGMHLHVRQGEIVTLLGRNGAGKTTTLKAIMGLIAKRSGSVRYNGEETIALPPEKIARKGIAFCPEERAIFSSLSVFENLMLPPRIADGGMDIDAIYNLFPNLKERSGTAQGTKLSGGEQQMLAIARNLRTGAKFLLLDEPTEGLAPVIVQQIEQTIRKIKTLGYTVVLVEQNFHFASTLADRHYVVEQGKVVAEVSAAEALADTSRIQSYLSV